MKSKCRGAVVTVSATRHTVPSLGFIVWERRRKLKLEFQNSPASKSAICGWPGTEVTQEARVPLVAYLGDSQPEGLDDCPAMYQAKVLITEMTFVAPSHRKDRIHKYGHTHLDDLVERRGRFENEIIIAAHFSTRYAENRIRRLVERALPDMLGGRLQLWV